MKNAKRLISLLIVAILSLSLFASCDKTGDTNMKPSDNISSGRYSGPYSDVNGAFGGVDSLGRTVELTNTAHKSDKKVGIMYFLWLGEHNMNEARNIYEIVQNNPESTKSESAWMAAGGGTVNSWAYWSEPLFGYYTSLDKWVYRKHLQLLMDADIDFIMIDATNGYTYPGQMKALLSVWNEYLEQGYSVPKIAYYTHADSGATVNKIYDEIYSNSKLRSGYAHFDDFWFMYDGKPLIIADPNDLELSQTCKDYFRIKEDVWPNEPVPSDDAFPWLEWSRMLSDDAVYGTNGRKEVVAISAAQHCNTGLISATAWYGGNDHTRSWHNGANDTSENAMYYGYNFQEQWDWAISVDPEIIYITGWNEWVAQRMAPTEQYPVRYCDNCLPNTSRDIEPMNGLFGDNYYMQMVENIRRYKGTAPRVKTQGNTSIDISGDFSQWDNVSAKYSDLLNDTVDRNVASIDKTKYVNKTGRNDFVSLKVANDANNVYFYAETASAITNSSDANWMTLFISSGAGSNNLWENQFDFAVNYESPVDGKAVLSKYNGSTWIKVGLCEMKVEGNKLMLSVSKSDLGIIDSNDDPINMQFKWADNYAKDGSGNIDIYSFYTDGDAAPIGRLTYVYSDKK